MNQEQLLKVAICCFLIAIILLAWLLHGCATPRIIPMDCRAKALAVGSVLGPDTMYAWGPSVDPRYMHIQACKKQGTIWVYYDFHCDNMGISIIASTIPSTLFVDSNNLAYITMDTMRKLR